MGDAAGEAMRRAMEAAGVDPDVVVREAPAAEISDEQALAQQAWQDDRKRLRIYGEACVSCLGDIRADDPHRLREITGWTSPVLPGDGSPALVVRGEFTGREICGDCAEAISGPKQERLDLG